MQGLGYCLFESDPVGTWLDVHPDGHHCRSTLMWFATILGSINMTDIVIQLWYSCGAARFQLVISR